MPASISALINEPDFNQRHDAAQQLLASKLRLFYTRRVPPGRRSWLLLFLALFIPYSYFNHSDGWNQGARLAELHALVLKGTLRIDDYLSYTGDRALIDGHYYSEKAPAMTVAALPSFAIVVTIQRALGVDPDASPATRWSEWIATACSVGAIAALGGVAFYVLLEAKFGALTAIIGTFGLFLGTLTFPYATSLFAHAGTIGLIAIALWGAIGKGSPRRDAIAGLAAGFAVASEYPAILVGTVVGLYLATQDPRRMLRYGVATLPAAVLIVLNNYAISGSPFKLSYGSNPLFPEIAAATSYGFSAPDPAAMRALIWGEYRGLLPWSPVMAMAIVGLIEMFRRDRALAVMTVSGCVLILLQVAAFYTWFGGNAFGPRYLAPALPLFGLAAAYGIHRFRKAGLILMILSAATMGMVTAIAIDPHGDVLTPLRSFYFARINQGRWADNLGTVIGLPLWLSLVVPAIVPALAAWFLLKEPRAAG
jgi:hypothetical protein